MQTQSAADLPRPARIEYSVPALAMLVVVALRWHTIDEPLDCDEAAYGYVAHRVLQGDRLYVDVFENKPPLAYLPYALGITLGGYTERSMRVLPVPFVLITLWLSWSFARRYGGRWAAAAAAALCAIASSDPCTFANGANLEVYMNAALVGSLCAAARARETGVWRWALVAGLCTGTAAALKQVGVLFLPLYGVYLARGGGRWTSYRLGRVAALCVGFTIPWLACVGFAAAQGVLAQFHEAVFAYGPTLAREAASQLRDTYGPAEVLRLNQWSPSLGRLVDENRWLLSLVWLVRGNPHATVWWATGTWPLWVMAVAAALIVRPRRGDVGYLVMGYMGVAIVAVLWPGLFWQHYYMLLVPVITLAAALVADRLVDALRGARDDAATVPGLARLALGGVWIAAAAGMLWLQWVHYVRLTPEVITTEYKGGGQWVALRQLGMGLRSTPGVGGQDRLFNWGWQSPLHLYSGLDSVTPYFFTDPLMQRYDTSDHPLVRPRKARIVADLKATPPKFIFIGQSPFSELQELLRRHYVPTTRLAAAGEVRGLYVRRDTLGAEPRHSIEDLR